MLSFSGALGAAALVVTGAVAPAQAASPQQAAATGSGASAANAFVAKSRPSGERDATGRRVPAAVPGPVRGKVVAKTRGVTWVRCGSVQCTTLEVPLDYARPEAGTLQLTVTRRPADRQSRRLGILVTNPGGPGGPAAQTVPVFASFVGRETRARFDIIGINPRGTGDDQPALCVGKPGDKIMDPPSFVYPMTPAQVATALAFDAYSRDLCGRSETPILAHMSSADSARDIDAVRAALGEKSINYYGVSYGSHLGATYSALFPKRVRTMVVDGTLDPVAWTTGRGQDRRVPSTARLGSGVGAHNALMSAIAECERVGADSCAEYATIRKDWEELSAAARKQPIRLFEDVTMSYDMLIAIVLSGLYDYEGVPDTLGFIHALNQVAQGGTNAPAPARARLRVAYNKVKERDRINRKTRVAYDPPAPTPTEEQPVPFYDASFTGVVCADGIQPKDPQAWPRAAAAQDQVAPGFGPLWTWASSVCAGWPIPSPGAYRGPFTKRANGGMLIMNTTQDPATPYSGAVAMRLLRSDSRLVTVPGWGHAVLDTSGCATDIRTNYLITGRLPARDRQCRQDHALFTSLK